MNTLTRGLVRAVALIALVEVWQLLALLIWPPGTTTGAALGVGLLSFALVLLVSLVWAVVDGIRHGWAALKIWGVAVALFAVAQMIGQAIRSRTLPIEDLIPDAIGVGLFFAGFALVGAALGGVAGSLVHARRT